MKDMMTWWQSHIRDYQQREIEIIKKLLNEILNVKI